MHQLQLWLTIANLLGSCLAFGAIVYYVDAEWDRHPRAANLLVVWAFSAAGVWLLSNAVFRVLPARGYPWLHYVSRPAGILLAALIIPTLIAVVVSSWTAKPRDRCRPSEGPPAPAA